MGKIMKYCSKCKQHKKRDDFFKNNFNEDGKYYICKDCTKESIKKQREKRKEGIIEAF